MNLKSKEYKEAVRIGKALIGKTAQSRLLCEINDKGQQVFMVPQLITGYEIVESFQEPCVMAIIDGVSIFEDCLFNIK